MTGRKPSLSMEDISPEARRAATEAAEAAGMPLGVWLGQLIKYVGAMERQGQPTGKTAPGPGDGTGGGAREAVAETGPAGIAPPPIPTIETTGATVPEAKRVAPTAENATPPTPAEKPEAVVTPDSPANSATAGFEAPQAAPQTAPQAEGLPLPLPEDTAEPAPAPEAPEGAVGAGRQGSSDQWSVGMAATNALRLSRFAAELGPAEADIDAAVNAWRRDGGFEPIVVRRDPAAPDGYEIIAGADRWQAAQRVEIKEVPVLIKEFSDKDAFKAVLVQQLRRKSISAIEEAGVYRRLLDEASLSLADLAKIVGRSPSHVGGILQLLDLPPAVQELVRGGEITVLHARALLDAANPEAVARDVVARRLDIYQTEQLVRSSRIGPPVPASDNANDNIATAQILERQLSALLRLKVSISEHGKIGVLSIHYTDRDQLSDVISRLNSGGG